MRNWKFLKGRMSFLGVALGVTMLFFCLNASTATQSYSLFTTPRARKVGDVVTVIISESSLASQSAKTDMGKKANTSGEISSFFQEAQGVLSGNRLYST